LQGAVGLSQSLQLLLSLLQLPGPFCLLGAQLSIFQFFALQDALEFLLLLLELSPLCFCVLQLGPLAFQFYFQGGDLGLKLAELLAQRLLWRGFGRLGAWRRGRCL